MIRSTRFLFLAARGLRIYGLSLATCCSLISVHCFLAATAYCSILATRFMLFWRSSKYAAPRLLLLIACYASTLSPVSCFRWRDSLLGQLHGVCSMLLPFVIDNLLLATTSLLFAAHLLFIVWWLNSHYMPLAIPHSLLTVHRPLFALIAGKSPLAPRRLF